MAKSKMKISMAAICLAVLAAPAIGQDAKLIRVGMAPQQTVEDSAAERINFSGKLRMLSQRIASATCHYVNGIDAEGSHKLLTGATAEFDKILTALEFGNDKELNIIDAEKRKKTVNAIHALRATWEPIKASAQAIVDGNGTAADAELILAQNMDLLSSSNDLVPILVKQYSNPNQATFANLMLIDISGRQRMLTQKMSKETCILSTAGADSEAAEALSGSINVFETSLEALRHGLPSVGISPPPNKQISSGLDEVLATWATVKPLLDEVRNGADISDGAKAAKFQQLNVTMAKMNEVVGMYAEATKKTY